MQNINWTAEEPDKGTRYDQLLAREMGISRAEAQRLLETGMATVNNSAVKPSAKAKCGDVLRAQRSAPAPTAAAAEKIPLEILFEDEHLLVINKPRGMVVHPAPGHAGGTLVNAVLGHTDDLPGIGDEQRPGIVHRLDKDTSGVMVVAKSEYAMQGLQQQIQNRTAGRTYTAVIWGHPSFKKAVIDAPIGRHPSDRKRMAVVTDPRHTSREARTHLEVTERMGPFSLVRARLETGRTHQIRVHCAWCGHPVVGDPLYGGRRSLPKPPASSIGAMLQSTMDELNGQALHAFELNFQHPATGGLMSFSAPVPEVMQRLIAAAQAWEGARL
jgi:23S rRNA pseudouridine1911/1915/1917 synthase